MDEPFDLSRLTFSLVGCAAEQLPKCIGTLFTCTHTLGVRLSRRIVPTLEPTACLSSLIWLRTQLYLAGYLEILSLRISGTRI